MARRATVRYWESRNGYCCWFQGHQHVLAEGPDDFPLRADRPGRPPEVYRNHGVKQRRLP